MDRLLEHIHKNVLEAFVFDGDKKTKPFVFMSISKSAKTSVWKALSRNVNGYYVDRYHANDFLDKDWTDYYKFCIVRNTYARLVSAYEFFNGRGKKARQFDNFSSFLGEYLVNLDRYMMFKEYRPKRIVASHIQRQNKFMEYGTGDTFIHDVYHFENLAVDWIKICDILNLKKRKLGHQRKNPRTPEYDHYGYYYSEDDKKLVRSVYKRELDLFGFKCHVPNVELLL